MAGLFDYLAGGSGGGLFGGSGSYGLDDPQDPYRTQLAFNGDPASIRFNNPGAMWPGRSATTYGGQDSGQIIGGGNRIASFPDPVSGAAAQFDLLNRGYQGMTLAGAITKWSGGNDSGQYIKSVSKETGLRPDTPLTPELLQNPTVAVPLAKAMAKIEAGRDFPLSDDQWAAAHGLVNGGAPMAYAGGGSPAGLPSQASDLPGGGQSSIPAMAQLTAGQMPPSGLPTGNAPPPAALMPQGSPWLAGLQGFANGGGLLPAIGNLIGGLATGQRQDKQGYEQAQQQQAQLAAYQAIRAAGGSEQQAVLGAMNPNVYGQMQKESEFSRTFGLAQQKEAREAKKPTVIPHLGTAIDPQTGQVIFGGQTSDNAKEIAEAIKTGKQPPVTTGLYGEGPSVKAELARSGFDLAKADLQYKAAVKQVQSLNGPQAIRYQTLATTVVNTIDEVNALAKQMENIGVPLVNRAKLELYKQTQGNSPNGQLAARYLAATNTLKEEFANLANGGYAPTEPAWKLASEQINADFGVKQLGASLEEVQRLIRYRLNAIPNNATLGPAATNNPYIGGAPAAPVAASPAPAAPSGGWSVQRIQ